MKTKTKLLLASLTLCLFAALHYASPAGAQAPDLAAPAVDSAKPVVDAPAPVALAPAQAAALTTVDAGVGVSISAAPAPAQGPTVTVPSVSKDPLGFIALLYKLASSKQYFWGFTIILMGLVEVTRAPWLLKKLPWLKGTIGAHVTTGLTAFILTLTVGGVGTHALTAGVFGTALIQAVLAGLGWKGRSAGADAPAAA